MTHSAFHDYSATVQRTEPQAAQPPVLRREATEFLTEMSVTLQKRAMYPPGHPYLQNSTERLMRRVETLLSSTPVAVFGIARDQIVMDGAATDSRNTIFSELAERLHHHRLATLRLSRGITEAELDRLVTLLSADAVRSGRGSLIAEIAPLEHVQVQPIEYDRLVLENSEPGAEGTTPAGRRSDDLWVDLARLAADSSPGSHASDETEAAVLARSIDCGSAEAGYDREILGRLTRLAEELSDAKTTHDPALQERLSKLLGSLRPGTLTRILAAGEGNEDRRRFVMAASASVDVGALMKILESVAAASHQEVSHHFLRLLRKMGDIGSAAPADVKVAADAALHANVSRLLDDWRLEDPNPERYTAVLDTMATTSPGEGTRVEACDPLVMLQMALEVGAPGPRTDQALHDALAAGRLAEVIGVLGKAPASAVVETMWERVATPRRLRDELRQGRLLSDSTTALIARLGAAAVDPLLELLAGADDRATRSATLRVLTDLGEVTAERVIALLPRSQWFVQRNLFLLLGRIGPWPDALPTEPYLTNADARVRREAIKLMVESPGRRDVGLVAGVMDSDDAIRILSLSAALESCPRQMIPMVKRIVDDSSCSSEVRTLAIRVFARTGVPGVVDTFANLALVRKFRFLPTGIAAKSPEVLAAIAGLASHWSTDPRAEEVLRKARRHRDIDIRSAASVPS